MNNTKLLKRVEASLKWKKSNAYCAKSLNIDLETYLKLKKELVSKSSNQVTYTQSVNLEKGESRIECITSKNPKTPEEIIKLLNIDTEVWKLSQYWNKQQNDKWLVSALVTQIKKTEETLLEDLLKNYNPSYKPLTRLKKEKNNLEDICAVLSIQDIHFGKIENDNITEEYTEAVVNLITKTDKIYNIDKLYYVIGGDILNVDTFLGTTTSGTPIGQYPMAYDMYKQAFDALFNSIRYMSEYANELHVVYIPGNHDRLSSYHLAHALSKAIREENIYWHVEYDERKVFTCGDNFFAFEHGDTNTKNSLMIYATENSAAWGITKYRTLYTGHYHKKKTIEYITEDESTGFTLKILPSLSKTDYYHYHNKFVGNKRAAIIDIHSYDEGKIAEFIYNAI